MSQSETLMSDIDPNKAELALHHLVTAAIEHRLKSDTERRAPREGGPSRLGLRTWKEITSASYGDAELEELIRDPIATSLRLGITKVGRMLFRHGGTKAMQIALERVADRDPAHYGYRSDIMDKAWEGIGSDEDVWTP